MTPSLVALTGPLQGRTFELTGAEVSIGRHPESDLRLNDPGVSRRHCVLRRTEGGWKAVDLDSRRGTFVNGSPLGERDLEQGDFLLIADSTFLVLLRAGERDEAAATEEEDGLRQETEIRLPPSESVYLQPGRLGAVLGQRDAAGSRTGEALAALLEIAARAGSTASSADLCRLLLERALAAIPAERAALLPVAEGDEPAPHFLAAGPAYDPARPFAVSRTIVERVLTGRFALLVSHAAEKEAPGSVEAAGIRALACAPLLALDAPLAILYLDTRDPGATLDEWHLQWLVAAAAMAAGPLAAALRGERMAQENRRLQGAAIGHGLVGESPALRRAYELLLRAAPTPSTVLLLGESGTGKELAAHALHHASRRAGEPFVAINCATLSETLLESELFGHEKGAFTGAVERKTGKLEVANGGTLFLDEVGELPLALQAKLLRVLQERTFERVGGTRPLRADVRLIAATNRNLPAAMAEGRFRADLYHRLNVVAITLPPLRERRDDIHLLALYFAARHGRDIRGREVGIVPAARALLERYAWPGNVRELGNAIERAVVLGVEDSILPEDLPEDLLETPLAAGVSASRYQDAVNELKRRLIVEAVRDAGGTITRAAERLGLHPNHLHRLITGLGLREEIEG